MLTYSPLPSWRSIFTAVMPAPRGTDLSAPWRGSSETAGWLSRSAWSLALIAQWRRAVAPRGLVTVWIPEFFCNASLLPLRHTGVRLVFYPVNAEMNADLAKCRELAEREPLDVFLVVHFFGKPAETAPVRDFCARKGAWLIEDAAQVLRPVGGIGEYGDFVIYSPHKLLPLPDGSVLIVRHDGPSKLDATRTSAFGDPESWARQLMPLEMKLRTSGAIVGAAAHTWLGKRVLQRLGLGRGARSAAEFDEDPTAKIRLPQPLASPEQSALSKRLLASLVGSLDQVARDRQRNQLMWDALLADRGLDVSPAGRPSGREWTPYLASYDARDAAQVYRKLRGLGIPVTTWPDIAPEVASARGEMSEAWRLRHSRFYLPVHQTPSSSAVTRRRHAFPHPARAKCTVVIEWDTVTREEWGELLTRADRSNLLQSWAYGEAKRETAGWRVKRGVAKAADRPIAIVQALEKRIGPLVIFRINRGPLFLPGVSSGEELETWRQISALGMASVGRVLSLAPELYVDGPSVQLIDEIGLKPRKATPYESAWIDVQQTEQSLRHQLDAKWRNKLKLAEQAQLEVDSSEEPELFGWMLERYRDLKTERGFGGPDSELLESLHRNLAGSDRIIVFRASHQGEAAAGLCIATHGSCATYLLGWNGKEGRRLRANQLLLWKAMLALRDEGVRRLDLGGFSASDTPGVMTFKLGLNGERYELAGEYLKW